MSLYSPNDVDQRPAPEATVLQRPEPIQAIPAPSIEPHDHHEQPARHLPRWPLIAIALAAVITLMWNVLLVWALIGAIFS